MIAVETNMLVNAHRRESRHHQEAASIVRGLGGRQQCLGDSLAMLLRVHQRRDQPSYLVG